MANPLLLDIASFLVAQGLATGDGEDVFRDFSPESPDNIIVLHEYQGDPAVVEVDLVNRSVQVSCRNTDPDTARDNAIKIFKALRDAQDEDNKVVFTTERWGQVYLRHAPFRLRMDENNRTIFGFNVGITTTIE